MGVCLDVREGSVVREAVWLCRIGRVLYNCVLGRFFSDSLCSVGVWDMGYVKRYVPVGGVSLL